MDESVTEKLAKKLLAKRKRLIQTVENTRQWLAYYLELLREYEKLKSANDSSEKIAEVEKDLLRRKQRAIELIEIGSCYFPQNFLDLEEISINELKITIRAFNRYINDIPTDIDLPEYKIPYIKWRKFLDTCIQEMECALTEKGGNHLSEAQQKAAHVASQVQVYLDAVRLLEDQCEEDVKNHPNQEAEIRRRYRRAIDALKDTA